MHSICFLLALIWPLNELVVSGKDVERPNMSHALSPVLLTYKAPMEFQKIPFVAGLFIKDRYSPRAWVLDETIYLVVQHDQAKATILCQYWSVNRN
jgi:hypothetical protein